MEECAEGEYQASKIKGDAYVAGLWASMSCFTKLYPFFEGSSSPGFFDRRSSVFIGGQQFQLKFLG
jgi:hypothetical protein